MNLQFIFQVKMLGKDIWGPYSNGLFRSLVGVIVIMPYKIVF